ncbi:MAG: hypothetical protein N3F64_06065 [Nitrososphaeria archaeon]|nr:hypothetical protein [Nitrososphaeria archaeon]
MRPKKVNVAFRRALLYFIFRIVNFLVFIGYNKAEPPVKKSRNRWDKYPIKYAEEMDKKLVILKICFNIKTNIIKENEGTKMLCKISLCLAFRSKSGNIVPKKDAAIIDKKFSQPLSQKILIAKPNAKII